VETWNTTHTEAIHERNTKSPRLSFPYEASLPVLFARLLLRLLAAATRSPTFESGRAEAADSNGDCVIASEQTRQ
jgi:hypothetical protein